MNVCVRKATLAIILATKRRKEIKKTRHTILQATLATPPMDGQIVHKERDRPYMNPIVETKEGNSKGRQRIEKRRGHVNLIAKAKDMETQNSSVWRVSKGMPSQ